MEKIFSFGYWFELMPGDLNIPFWRVMFVVVVLCVALGVFSLIKMRMLRSDGVRRRLWSKVSAFGWTVAPIIVVIWFFRYQNAYFLGMRVWIAVWLAVAALWLLFILRFAFMVLPKRLKARADRESIKKYLPH